LIIRTEQVLITLPRTSPSSALLQEITPITHLMAQDSPSVDLLPGYEEASVDLLPGDGEVPVQAPAVGEEEGAMAIVAVTPKRDLLTDPERHHQIQNTLRGKRVTMAITVLEDPGALVVVAEEDIGVDGATTDTKNHLLQDQVGLI
jgi:hypothetical protein